jgi:hypothetical protein
VGYFANALKNGVNSACGTWVTADTMNDSIIVMVEDAVNLDVEYTAPVYYHYSYSIGMLEFHLWREITGAVTFTTRGYSAPNRIATYVPATGTPRYDVFHDQAFIVNGVGRGLVYGERGARPFPLQAPGEPMATPLIGGGAKTGTYRYALRPAEDTLIGAGDTLVAGDFSVLSQPVRVDSGSVLLYGFPRRGFGAYYNDTVAAHGDSVTWSIWCLTGDARSLDKLDTIWNTGLTVHVDSSNFDTITVIDSLTDATLRIGTGRVYMVSEWDSISGVTAHNREYLAPGRPMWLRGDTASGDSGVWANGTSVVDWSTCAGWAIMVVAVDTSSGLPSDSSTSLMEVQIADPANYTDSTFQFSRLFTEKLSYVLPRLWDTSLVLLVYRGPVDVHKMDSVGFRNPGIPGRIPPGEWVTLFRYGSKFTVPGFYLIGQFNGGDTVVDSLRYDSLKLRQLYERNALAGPLTDVEVFDRRLFVSNGRYLMYTDPSDTSTIFRLFDNTPINPDDGDQNTAMWPAKGLMRAAKTGSMYSVYDAGQGAYRATELSAHYGVIAPLSHVDGPEGDWILSKDGVRFESEGPYKDRSFIGELASAPLRSFRKQPLTVLRNGIGFYYDDKYLLSLPDVETTFVCNKIMTDGGARYAWSTWGLVFGGAAMYRSAEDHRFTPPDTFYFTKPGGSSLYRFGSSATDNGVAIAASWESGALGPKDGHLWEPTELGLWVESEDTTAGALLAEWKDDQWNGSGWGGIDTAKTVEFGSLRSRRLHVYEIAPGIDDNDCLYWSVRLRVAAGVSLLPTTVEGLTVTLTDRGPAVKR